MENLLSNELIKKFEIKGYKFISYGSTDLVQFQKPYTDVWKRKGYENLLFHIDSKEFAYVTFTNEYNIISRKLTQKHYHSLEMDQELIDLIDDAKIELGWNNA